MPPPRGLAQRLDQSLHRSNLLPPHSRLLLAISGGADSVALLRLLHSLNNSNHWHWHLTIAHIDHGIRGKSSKADAAFVKALAKKLKLPYASKSLKLGPKASEDKARTARLAALRAIAKQKKSDAVVMAHHADDQAETVLMRLFRGTGIKGLAAIAPRKNIGILIARPLLDFRRHELRTYLASIKQNWREDESNAGTLYLRNRLRHELLPQIEKHFPAASDALCRLAAIAHEFNNYLALETRTLRDAALTHSTPKKSTFLWPLLRRAHPALLAEFLRTEITALNGSSESTDQERIRHAVTLIRGNKGKKTIQLGGGISLHIAAGLVTISRETSP